MKNIVLVRHGESQWNKENRFTGWTNVDLSEKGLQEALDAGKALKGEGSISGTTIKAGEALLVLGEQELRFEPNGHLTLLTTR